MDWQLHWLEASGDLGLWREQIVNEVAATFNIVSKPDHAAPGWIFWCSAATW
jgi:hypothetical protein